MSPGQLELWVTRPPAESRHSCYLDGVWVPYVVRRRAGRRRITLLIDERGLRVAAPLRTPLRGIEEMLTTHARWIKRKLADWQTRLPAPLEWQEGVTICFKGLPLTVERSLGPTQREQNRLSLDVPLDGAGLREKVVDWLRGEALNWFRQRVAYFVPAMDVPMPRVALSNARTRWGSCHVDGRIRLNWRMIQMPEHLIDYVVVHELAHLHEPNHAPRFWLRVAKILPDHEQRRRELRTEGHRYLI